MSNVMNDAPCREVGRCFPLTPALSLGERENRSPSLARTCVWIGGTRFRISRKLRRLFPLREGEDQGEGKRDSTILRETKGRMFAA